MAAFLMFGKLKPRQLLPRHSGAARRGAALSAVQFGLFLCVVKDKSRCSTALGEGGRKGGRRTNGRSRCPSGLSAATLIGREVRWARSRPRHIKTSRHFFFACFQQWQKRRSLGRVGRSSGRKQKTTKTSYNSERRSRGKHCALLDRCGDVVSRFSTIPGVPPPPLPSSSSPPLLSDPMLLHQFMNGALEVMHPSPLQKDTTFTKIFVGGLPYHTTDASLRKYFEAFGDIDEAVVITDRQTGKSRGYGFVSTHDTRPATLTAVAPQLTLVALIITGLVVVVVVFKCTTTFGVFTPYGNV